ncbi:MAG: helix-turn-helix domain-containing protein [Ruminococcus sp.]|nr:helix-turn-helix domain-containing protein [Ruminococcus sp.]
MYNDKLVIGIITASACQSEQRQLLDGIISQAQKAGAITVILSNIYNSSEYYAKIEIENKIYELISSKKIDGLILTAESFLNDDLKSYIFKKISSRNDIPVVISGYNMPGYTCINNDIHSDFENLVKHLVEAHGFTDIDLLTGQKNVDTSHERKEGYKKVLTSNGIPYDESKVIYGDFWMSSGEALAWEYINGERRLPQAIVCANDYMAFGLLDTFLENGISVPDDVTVVGYEFIGERFYHAPILTTYQRNRRAVGKQAFNLLWEKMTGKTTESVSIDGKIIYGSSCTCKIDNNMLSRELQAIRREQYYSQLNLVGNFEQELTLCRSISDYIRILQQFTYLIRDINGVHLCLYENWCSSDLSTSSDNNNSDTMIYYRVITRYPSSDEPVFFNKYELFPDEVSIEINGTVFYLCPIFFSGRDIGYFILQYDKPDGYDIIFRDWIKIAASALESLRMRNDITTLLESRNLSEHHDSVTGLYNETGLKNELIRTLNAASPEDNVSMIVIRSELFTDNTSLDRQSTSVRIDMEIAENLKSETLRKDTFCAKIADKLYLFCSVGSFDEKYEQLVCDRLSTLISHSPIYSENCSTDSLVVCSLTTSVSEFNFSSVLKSLRESLNEQISRLSDIRKHQNYSDYLRLRNELYLNPQKEWNAQTSCRDFRLSYGHFRATYKELFDISFHQDVIRSRISYAKYLLLTTALSLTSIAYKCGYEDEKYFMRQFRQLSGVTPNAFRSKE